MSTWELKENKLCKQFMFKDFVTAMQFINKVAEIAEAQNHHPEWSNVYNKVNIKLSTHDAGNIVTDKDYKLAEGIDGVFEKSF